LTVHGERADLDAPVSERIQGCTRYSAAWKWGYAHAVLYGNPRTPHDPHITVLEIAEDAFIIPEDAPEEYPREPVPPFPYAVLIQLGFTTHLVFADNLPDLTRLMGEVLPLIGSPAPQNVEIYDLHKWDATYGGCPI
jgi:hypothetical protein